MSIKLIVCDLDGTLIGQELRFSPRLLETIKRARHKGIAVTIATGRGFPSARRFVAQMEIDIPVICYQGAQINSPQGKVLQETPLPRTCLPPVIEFCQREDWELTVYYNDEIYHTVQKYNPDYYARWFGLPLHLVDDLLSAIPGDPLKFIAIAPDTQTGDELERAMRSIAGGRFQIMRSHAFFVEGLANGVSKGNAIARLAGWMGISRREVMAIGDDGNDVAMIEWAGIGVAMGNAAQSAKAVADVIAPPLEQDGAAWAIEQYALEETL